MDLEKQQILPEVSTPSQKEGETTEVEGFVQITYPVKAQEVEKLDIKEKQQVQIEEPVAPIRNEEQGDLSATLSDTSYSYNATLTSQDAANIEIVKNSLKCHIGVNLGSSALRLIFLIFSFNIKDFVIAALISYWMLYVSLLCRNALKRGLSSKKDFEEYEKVLKKANFLAKFFFFLGLGLIVFMVIMIILVLVVAMGNIDQNSDEVKSQIGVAIGLFIVIISILLFTLLPYGVLYCKIGSVLVAMNQLRDTFDGKVVVGGLDISIG